jgi:hypothetical protein
MATNDAGVVVIDERVLETFPAINKPAYTAVITYKGPQPVPRTVFLNLSDVAPGKEKDLQLQVTARKGQLYDSYLRFRAKKIKEDIEGSGSFTPQTVRF